VPAKRNTKQPVNFFSPRWIENNHIKSSSKTVDFLIALTVNAVILAGPILAGLIYTDTLNLRQFETTFLMAPLPPPPAPTVVPKNIADIKEAPLPPDFEGGGVVGGLPGGVAGGSMGGVIGGVILGVHTTVVAPLAPKVVGRKRPYGSVEEYENRG
jgi:hypothetical protein